MTIHESQQISDEDETTGVFLDDFGSSSSSTGRITPDNPLFKGNSTQNKPMMATTIDTQQQSPLIPSEIHSPPRHGTLPESFHGSPEPIRGHPPPAPANSAYPAGQPYHLLGQIQEDEISQEKPDEVSNGANEKEEEAAEKKAYFVPCYPATRLAFWISTKCFEHEDFAVATWMGFWALHNVTCANYVLSPMRDAVALQVGVKNIPKLTLASSVLAFLSSVPIGWLFEAPDPGRRKLWKKMGLTRGETQGTSLALFYRFFALSVLSYAAGFQIMDLLRDGKLSWLPIPKWLAAETSDAESYFATIWEWIPFLVSKLGKVMYIAFFLVVHLMKLHSISLVWGVTTEAMEYEDVARKGQERKLGPRPKVTRTRLQRLAMVGFGGTLGGIWGSILASSMANILGVSGLLIVSAFLLEISAELSIELGLIMKKHWEEQQIFRSSQDLASLDTSMKRSVSLGSMKRVASGNSLMKKVSSKDSMSQSSSTKSLSDLDKVPSSQAPPKDDTFTQRLLRGITTILKSRLLMAIFTYNALFASTSTLLSFQRAELVANRKSDTTVSADTAFLANINIASSMAVFAFQASGIGAMIAQRFGPQGTLSLMPAVRLVGVLGLTWWHRVSNGQAPNLILFLMLDECTRVINLAVAKPVRENLWRGLSNEARYEAKPIVDTLANRWGAGSASFCVSVVNKALLWLGLATLGTDPSVFGLTPNLFLCLLVAAWWAMVSLDLGQVRKRIDMELKKHQ
mmetsp:Transcript_19630/g.48272  ORF Transcript_19630/g.48272 Transcript_19630/m.48272 type:complete len:741 (+) Transcript_19630:184-2406(+)